MFVHGSPSANADGLPIGLHIVGRTNDDFRLLQWVHAFAQVTGDGQRRSALAL